jgi:hypothetical protein
VDLNLYVVEVVARQRLAELRAMADARAASRMAPQPRPLRVTTGLALQRFGAWMAGAGALERPRAEAR